MEKKMKLMQCMADIPSKARRLFTVFLMMVASVLCTEAQTLINGIYYTLDSNTATATVTSGSTLYSGDVNIPSYVTYGGKTYTVTTIGSRAFNKCNTLSSVSIPSTVSKIAPEAFYYGCNSLSKFTVDGQNSWYIDVDGVIYSKDKKQLVRCPNARDGIFTIPDYVEAISTSAFQYCKISEVKIPNSVKKINNNAFFNCNGLTSIYIPASVQELAGDALSACYSLETITVDQDNQYYVSEDNVLFDKNKTILYLYPINKGGEYTIPNTVTELGVAFDSNKYTTSITIPKSVVKMTYYSFGSCSGLKTLICLADVPPTINKYTFYNTDKSITIYVPAASIEAYKSADYWSEFTNFQAIAEPAKTEWRISDRTDIDVDFHSINEAMADERVQDGHTLYIERGTSLGDEKITKSVNVIGPGYDGNSASVKDLYVNAAKAKVVGLSIGFSYISENDIDISHCSILAVYGNKTSNENSNCTIHSCFIGDIEGFGDENSYEWTLTNNIIRGKISNFEEMTLNHNTIVNGDYALYNVNNSTITNNVLFNTVLSSAPMNNCLDNEYAKNIVSYTCNTGDEQKCETLEKIISCTGNTNSEDYYTPVGYSIGYSTDGTDCGAFGGSNPYVKGGKSGLFVEREGEEEPEPTYPETPIIKGQLDNTATLDIVNDVYNSLGEFLKALSIRGINAGTEIAVANQQFDFALDDATYGYIQTAATNLEMAKAYIYMKAENQAIFNITLSPAFAAAHVSDVQTVVATIMAFANHIITTNIKIFINGTLYQYTGFQIEPNDLLDLKNMYNAMGGEKWSKKWSFLSNGRQTSDFPGVTFTTADEMGYSRVQEIDLSKNNLSGNISSLALNFPKLTTINLYGNSLTGDATEMVRGLSSLTSLNISYNLLTGLTSLPSSVSSLYKGGQLTGASTEYIESLNAIKLYISDKQEVKLPTIMTYDLATNSNVPVKMFIKERDNTYSNTYYGTLAPYNSTDFIYATKWVNNPYTYEYAQDHEIYLRSDDGTIYPAILKYEAGDANMSGYTDLLDVQTTISKVLSPSIVSLFNKTAANTYNDETINVQDVVCTVNIVLGKPIISIEIPTETGNHYDQPLFASRRATPVPGGTGNILFVESERLWLTNETEVGAIEVELRGLSADEVSLALNSKDFQMASLDIEGGSRHIIYSLSGKSVPVGTAAILRLSNDYAEVADAALSTVDAKSLSFTIGDTPTAINTVGSGNMLKARLEGNGIVVSSSREISNAEIVVTSASGVNTLTWKGERIKAGKTMIEANLARGIYIIGIYENGKRIGNYKLIKK